MVNWHETVPFPLLIGCEPPVPLIPTAPYLIRDGNTVRGLTNDRYDYVIGVQKKMTPEERLYWPDTTLPEPPASIRPSR